MICVTALASASGSGRENHVYRGLCAELPIKDGGYCCCNRTELEMVSSPFKPMMSVTAFPTGSFGAPASNRRLR